MPAQVAHHEGNGTWDSWLLFRRRSRARWEGVPNRVTRKVHEQTLNVQTGKRSSKGNAVKFNRGDLVLMNCNVTGSNYGTATKPKFPLLELWTIVLLPELEALVKPGGPCEGAIVVHQEDNAGPHIDTTYKM